MRSCLRSYCESLSEIDGVFAVDQQEERSQSETLDQLRPEQDNHCCLVILFRDEKIFVRKIYLTKMGNI